MNKIKGVGVIVLALGFIVAGIGTFVGSDWSFNNMSGKAGPYAYTVGIAGLVVLLVGIYFITSEKAG